MSDSEPLRREWSWLVEEIRELPDLKPAGRYRVVSYYLRLPARIAGDGNRPDLVFETSSMAAAQEVADMLNADEETRGRV